MVEVGQPAPEFTLVSTDRSLKSSKDFLGKKLVIAFFCGAFTPVCTKELCAIRDDLSNLQNLGAQVVAISVDSPFANKAFAEANGLNFPLLSDYSREAVKAYDVALNDFAGLKGYVAAKRSIFIVDSKGIVRYKWITDDPTVLPNYDEIRRKLKEIE